MMIYALALLAGFEDFDALDAQVASAAAAIGATAAPVDRRLRLRQCPEGVQIDAVDARSLGVRCPVLGWRLRVALIGPATVAGPEQRTIVVRRGDPVTVRSAGAGFAVETSGLASEDGATGATVRVRLDGGTRQVSGIVTGPQEISVGSVKVAATRSLPELDRGFEEQER